jgi:CHAT domain-containing protein
VTFEGDRALEEEVKRVHSPRILHLATHGFYYPPPAADQGLPSGRSAESRLRASADALLRSGLVLAGANAPAPPDDSRAEDGWLTAEEAALLDLRGTELVVLSACESGLGDIRAGEGVYGLRRAFMYAGARSLVSSLFEVPDQETRELMRGFYKNLRAGKSKLAALHDAQHALLRARRAKIGAAHPFFWASFGLIGDLN